ncbi:MAG: 16S rRNA methyltransferase [Ktedonobacteraceae bacterium]
MLKAHNSFSIDTVIEGVLSSANYKYVCPDLVRAIATQEVTKRRTLKEALKATKNKLHQVGGVYLDGSDDYGAWLDILRNTVQMEETNQLRNACKRIMSNHASTRERLPILDQFYSTLLAELGPISSILDLACGLNPLALPWLPLVEGGHYYAYDMYQHMMDFLEQWLLMLHVHGQAQVCNLAQSCPTQQVDIALVLKTIPCLEQVDKHAGRKLLQSIHAKHMLVSFPLQSLGGKSKGMATFYEEHFLQLVAQEAWSIRKIVFATELVFIITK